MSKRCILFTPEERGGIRTYADTLGTELLKTSAARDIELVQLARHPIDSKAEVAASVTALCELRPDLIHVQHEFGLFGSKLPPFYRFPEWVQEVRRKLPNCKVVATAHTVLSNQSEYPWRGRGIQIPVRWLLNRIALTTLRRLWTRGTWGGLDGVIVHSELQKLIVEASGCRSVKVIPHYVPQIQAMKKEMDRKLDTPKSRVPAILVFGYFSPEKGQDIVIRAFAQLKSSAQLILAGGVRREADRKYFKSCLQLLRELGVCEKVQVTGFVPADQISEYYQQATLVVAPFRETSGSGSLVQALARGASTLASDLPLNRELNERVPGCLALFASEDFMDCAEQMKRLLADPAARERLAQKAIQYGKLCAIERVSAEHLSYYKELFT